MDSKKDKDLKTPNVDPKKNQNISNEKFPNESTRRPSEGYEGSTGSIGSDRGSTEVDESRESDLNEDFDKAEHRNVETDRKSRP